MDNLKTYCESVYAKTYNKVREDLLSDILKGSKNNTVSVSKETEIDVAAQKEAIKQATLKAMDQYPDIETADIWRAIYEIHVHRKSGIDNAEVIEKVISADQSWKKSSGHAFEEMVKFLGSSALRHNDIEIILQRDLNTLIKAGEIANEPRDISWLKEQIKGSVFDLYAIVTSNGKKFCYGCIQSKTSIRDRVTRDREPSMQAMQSFFWSTIIVLDGDFLKLPKFISMVNGNSKEFPTNGWHAMYVFSKKYTNGRIYSTDLDFSNFKDHAVKAANFWLKQRQWFDSTWSAEE